MFGLGCAGGVTGLGLAARLAAWRVLRRAGNPAAADQLALALAELEYKLSGFANARVRERVASQVPWHRDVLDAAGRTSLNPPLD